ncbi:HesA/MoeB/ThiF family protein [Pseudothermotoga sp. U03pept]|uniref:HesA/MoeB/ThiF family protein n=1 Tax=Pseudothermotoga sp. U03pept TaxID=3447012 RepID=UPI003F0501A5
MFERHNELLGECMERLHKAKVFVAGTGGLGCAVLSLLVRTGVGSLCFTDNASVDEPDLNRQILYDRDSLGKKKVEEALVKLKRISPSCELLAIEDTIDESFNLPDVDVVVDCLDNFKSKFVLDELCQRRSIPLVHAGVEGYIGQATTIVYGKTPTLRNLFRGVNDHRVRQVFPPLVVLMASVQVAEVIKLICGMKDSLVGEILLVDLLRNSFEKVRIV